MMYINFQPGLATSDAYPFQESTQHNGTFPCRYSKTTSIGSTTGYGRIKPGNETLLRDVVASVGPVVMTFNAEVKTFMFYRYAK